MSFFVKEETYKDRYGDPVTKKVVNKPRVFACLAAFFLVFTIVTSVVTFIPAGHTGVISTFGKVSDVVLQEGPNIKAPWQKITKMDNRIVKMEVETEAFSSDLQTVKVKMAVNYRVDPSKSHFIIKNVGRKFEDILIAPAVHEVMKSIVANYTAERSIASRNEISLSLVESLNEKLNQNGIYTEDINIVDFDFNDTYISAIEAKQVAEQQRLQAQIEQERLTMEKQADAERKVIEAEAAAEVARVKAQADAEVARVAAEAEAEVTRINADAAAYAGNIEAEINAKIAASLTDTLVEYSKIEQWDGKLPEITGSDSIIAMAD